MPEERRVIKRYANRKLYDTKESRYITLEQIAELIREGDDIVVVDKNTNDDLTSVTLAQIIFEEEKQSRSFLPLGALRKVIQTGGGSLTDLMTQITGSAERVGRVFRRDEKGEVIEGDQPHEPAKSDDTEVGTASPRSVREWVDTVQRTVDDWQHRFDGTVHQVIDGLSPLAPLHRRVQELQQRVEELEQLLAAARRKNNLGTHTSRETNTNRENSENAAKP